MDLLTVLETLGAVVTGAVPVAIILLWLIWLEVRRTAAADRDRMKAAAKKAKRAEETKRAGAE